ncbi:hypothetical protein JCGZ_20103 [Jatropha curcas]|uniref:Aminotransferase-like plant mobile domain-containing protein n=1 Tax=Jatropha curcas TaxID=180498 RepID=A0A067JXI9_JATCU|nr:hypothetical protein JCGZ_20103 [Jatropha curcas]
MVHIVDLLALRKIPCMKILSNDEDDSNLGMIFTFQRSADEYFGAKAPSKVDPPHLMNWTIEPGEESIPLWDLKFLGGFPIHGSFYNEMIPSAADLSGVDGAYKDWWKAKWSKVFPQDEMLNLRPMPKLLKSSKASHLKNSNVEKGGCVPLNPPQESIVKKCKREAQIMLKLKKLEKLKGQLDDSLNLEKEAIANCSFVEDELIKIEEELARLTSRKKVLESSLEGMKSDVLEKQSTVSKIFEEISKVEAMPIRSAEDNQSLSPLLKLLSDKHNELEQLEWNP